jgi:hypothetical protein
MIAVLLILLATIVIFLLWLLIIPVYLIVDTSADRYEIFQFGIFKLTWQPAGKFLFRLRILGIPVSMKTGGRSSPGPSEFVKKKRKGKTASKSFDTWLYLVRGIIKSFRVKRLHCSVDTDDVVLNAQLYPVVLLMNQGRVSMNVNFNSQNYLDLAVVLKVYRVCWTLIRFFIKK